MVPFTYEQLYGVNLDEYCRLQDTTIEELIKKSNIDIEIMYNNLDILLYQKLSHDEGFIIDTIFSLIRKKQAHIFALQNWQQGITPSKS